jgi:hypothetical protein
MGMSHGWAHREERNHHMNGSGGSGEFDPIVYGRMLIDLGVALLQGRLRLVPADSVAVPLTSEIALSDVANQRAHVVEDASPIDSGRFVPPAIHGRQNARGRFSARKGYVVRRGKGALDLAGVTPAGNRLVEYLMRNPGSSATMIAGDLGLSRKTVENLLSILRQRSLVDATDLKK